MVFVDQPLYTYTHSPRYTLCLLIMYIMPYQMSTPSKSDKYFMFENQADTPIKIGRKNRRQVPSSTGSYP